ncbi:MAG: hypothetical protein ACI35O_03975 [Bacillaceae bacterium]
MEQPKGRYKVIYKNPRDADQRQNGAFENKLHTFEGEIENYVKTNNGTCAFRNENGNLLLVKFADIVQMSLLDIVK